MNAMAVRTYHTRGIRRGMRDGVEVHKAAVASGCQTKLYPRQVLRVVTPTGVSSAFTHGLPQASTLSGVTFTQDLRMRRGLLGKAGIQQPRGATFSIGRGRSAAQRYAAQLGYPVVVKPAWGDSTIDVIRGVKNSRNLKHALDTLLVPPHERPNSSQASYGLTELRKPGHKNGRETVPPGYRVLIEEEILGDYYRLLVLNGQVIDVLLTPDGPWGEQAPLEPQLSEPLRAHFKETAKQVCAALTGLAVLTIDVVVPRSNSVDDRPTVVEVSERPWLEVQYRLNPARASSLAREILAFETRLPEEATVKTSGSVTVQFQGLVACEEFTSVLGQYATGQGIETSVESKDQIQGRATIHLTGNIGTIIEMVEVFLDSGVNGQTAMKADLRSVSR